MRSEEFFRPLTASNTVIFSDLLTSCQPSKTFKVEVFIMEGRKKEWESKNLGTTDFQLEKFRKLI